MKPPIAIILITLAAMFIGCSHQVYKPYYRCPDDMDSVDCACLKAGDRELLEMKQLIR